MRWLVFTTSGFLLLLVLVSPVGWAILGVALGAICWPFTWLFGWIAEYPNVFMVSFLTFWALCVLLVPRDKSS